MRLRLPKRYSVQLDPTSKDGTALIRTPFFYPNGDRIYITAAETTDERFILSDAGCTVETIWEAGVGARFGDRLLAAEFRAFCVKRMRADDGSIHLMTWAGRGNEAEAIDGLVIVCKRVMEANLSASALSAAAARKRSVAQSPVSPKKPAKKAPLKPSLTASSNREASKGQRPRSVSMSRFRGKKGGSGDSIARGRQSSSQ